MAELLECKICGYITVRCGMHNHLKAKHPLDYIGKPFDQITLSVGQVKHWSEVKKEIRALNEAKEKAKE
jgi:hypothetical protein